MSTPARSLAGDLRRRDDDELLHLLRARPDLAQPIPRSFADLALRANTAASTLLALEELSTAELTVLEAASALAAAGPFSLVDLGRGLTGSEEAEPVAAAVRRLFALALLWGTPDDIRVPSAAREAMGQRPCGLDPASRTTPAVARAAAEPEVLLDELARAPEPIPEAVRALAWSQAETRPIRGERDIAAVEWLGDRGLLFAEETGGWSSPAPSR
jgi:hypothetical protein